MRLTCKNVAISFRRGSASEPVLRNVSFETRPSEFLAILGPSGCGKTTLLRLLAGLIEPSCGTVHRTPSPDDGVAGPLLVRQENSLFPWMTALDNACFGLAMQGVTKAEREGRALALFERLGLSGWQNAYPHQLSVGMKQRVAVMRGFLSNPALLLMDEPFAALDAQSRMTLQQELLDLKEQWGQLGVVFVTHDIEEAILLSDRILIFSQRPASVVAEIENDLSRPRSLGLAIEPDFIDIKRSVLHHLGVPLASTPYV